MPSALERGRVLSVELVDDHAHVFELAPHPKVASLRLGARAEALQQLQAAELVQHELALRAALACGHIRLAEPRQRLLVTAPELLDAQLREHTKRDRDSKRVALLGALQSPLRVAAGLLRPPRDRAGLRGAATC